MRRDGTAEDLLSRPGPLAIVLVLLHRGAQSIPQLEAAIGVQPGTIRYHVDSLRQAGLVSLDEAAKPNSTRIVDPARVAKMLNRVRPGWAEGGIPRGALWCEVQAAIDQRRVRATYRTSIPFKVPTHAGFRRRV